MLGWNNATSFEDGAPADLVLGQPDFYTGTSNTGGESLSSMKGPIGVAVDSSGNLYVSDASNNRVLEFNAPFAACGNAFPCVGGAAAVVFGLTGTSTQSCVAASSTSLCNPKGVAVDANNNLFVADATNNRVLEYISPLVTTVTPGSGDTTPDLVFGQAGAFTTGDCNHPSSTVSASSLCNPSAVTSDASGNIYIADNSNSRVLEFNETNPPSNVTANTVFGQRGSLTTKVCVTSGLTAADLCNPAQMAFDTNGNLYIADPGHARVLEFNTPLTTTAIAGSGDTTADRVFGQADSMASRRAISAFCITGGGYVVQPARRRAGHHRRPVCRGFRQRPHLEVRSTAAGACNPDAHCHFNGCDPDSNRDSYSNGHCDVDSNGHCDFDFDGNSIRGNSYAHCYGDGNCDSDGDSYGDRHSKRDSYGHPSAFTTQPQPP